MALVAVLLAVTPQAAAAARVPDRPAAPTSVRVPTLAHDEDSVTLVWEKPAEHKDIVDYRVYRDGRYLGSAGAQADRTSPAQPYIDAFYADPANARQVRVVADTFTATGLRPDTRYRFTVRSVDAHGIESPDSQPVVQSTTPVPVTVDVADYGAVGDGTTVNTAAIQAAIDATPAGGKTLIPAGVFKTGAIWLHSDMTLQVGAGATLLGSDNAADYPWDFRVYPYSTDIRFYSLVNAHTFDYGTLRNIRIVGPGTIDGNGWKQAAPDADGFPVSAPSSSGTVTTNGVLAAAQVARATALGSPSPYATRSNLITLRGVDGVYYGGFTALNPAQHTLVNLHTNDVTLNGVRLLTGGVNNADGIEFGNSHGLTVINNVFDTGDDDVNFAAGLGARSASDPPARDAWIADNYVRKGHGAVVAGSHTGAWIEDITAEDNVIDGTDVALRLKTDPNNGGGARRILFRDNAVKNVGAQAFIFTSAYSDPNAAIVVEPARTPAQFRDVWVQHVTVDGTGKEAINVTGVAQQPHTRLHFDGVDFRSARPASIQYLTDSTFHDVVFERIAEPWQLQNSTGLSFTGTTTRTGVTADAAAKPSWPSGSWLTGSATDTTATLSWTPATEGTYRIQRAGSSAVVTATGTSTTVSGLAPATTYTFQAVAVDATGNATAGPTVTLTTTGTPDTTAPTAPPGGPTAETGTTWVRLHWQPAADAYGVDHYLVAANGTVVSTVDGTRGAATVGGLTAGTRYSFTVTAVDTSGNATGYGTPLVVTTNPPYDTGAPVWPAHARLRVVARGAGTVTVAWPAATDDQRVLGYRVYVDGRPVTLGQTFTPVNGAATTTGLTYTVSGLARGTRHTITVQAGDPANRWTGSGPSLTVTG
jgi:exo-poly-alpha-galacturonosidase